MRRSFGLAAIMILTFGRALAAPLAEIEPADELVAPAEHRESAAWREARLALFGDDETTAPSRAPNSPGVQEGDPFRCALRAPGADLASSERCIDCHARAGVPHSSHPVNVGYALAQLRSAGRLRRLEQVVARGVFLPDGMVQCTTCHDARSRWANHIALPPGAVTLTAVEARKPHTYEGRPNWRTMTAVHSPPLPDGTAVSPAPLCAACHRLAD